MNPSHDRRRGPELRIEPRQELALVPALQAIEFLRHHAPIPLANRNSAEIVRAAQQRNYELQYEHRTLEPRLLLAHVITSQCDFNFVGPLLRLHDENGWLICRRHFIETMGKEPYAVMRDGTPSILELSIQEGSCSGPVYGYSQSLVSGPRIEVAELRKIGGLEEALLCEGRDATSRLRERRRGYKVGDQLEVTAYCLLLPLRFGLEPFQVDSSRVVLQEAINLNGDFCFPVPKNLESALA